MNRQLSRKIADNENALELANDLVTHGLISEVDAQKVATKIEESIKAAAWTYAYVFERAVGPKRTWWWFWNDEVCINGNNNFGNYFIKWRQQVAVILRSQHFFPDLLLGSDLWGIQKYHTNKRLRHNIKLAKYVNYVMLNHQQFFVKCYTQFGEKKNFASNIIIEKWRKYLEFNRNIVVVYMAFFV